MTAKGILAEEAIDLIDLMRKRLAEPITKQGSRGQYKSNTIASGKLLRSLRAEVTGEPDDALLTIAGTDYWRAADAGQKPPVQVTVPDILKWMAAKRLGNSERIAGLIVRKLKREGTNKPPSEFFSRNRQQFSDNVISRLTTIATDPKELIDEIRNIPVTVINISG